MNSRPEPRAVDPRDGQRLAALRPRIERCARWLVGLREPGLLDFEDVTQIVLCEVLRTRAALPPGPMLDSWLWRFVRNVVLNEARRERRRRAALHRAAEARRGWAESSEPASLLGELRVALSPWWEIVPPDARAALRLLSVVGDADLVASMTGTPRVRLHWWLHAWWRVLDRAHEGEVSAHEVRVAFELPGAGQDARDWIVLQSGLGWSAGDLAALLGRPAATVRQILCRARRRRAGGDESSPPAPHGVTPPRPSGKCPSDRHGPSNRGPP